MQTTLKEPDWVGEDALAMKREATEARKARFTRARARAVARRAHQNKERRVRRLFKEAGRRAARRPCGRPWRFAAESAMRKDRGGAYPELRSTLEYKGLSDEQVMKRGTNIVPGADVDTWDFFARNETPPLRPVSPGRRRPARVDGADLQAPQTEVWRPRPDGLRHARRDAIKKAGHPPTTIVRGGTLKSYDRGRAAPSPTPRPSRRRCTRGRSRTRRTSSASSSSTASSRHHRKCGG